jgi:manganese/iron transport system ATP-binding protein
MIRTERIVAGYGDLVILKEVSVEVGKGQTAIIVGPNGAGKSTLFKALVGLLPLRSGEVTIHGRPLGSHLDAIAYVPQREDVDWRFPVSVADVVMMGRYGLLGWLRRPGKKDHAVVAHSLERMGLLDLAGHPIGELSGGQQQRVFLARALAQEPHILLMDEPFSGIDVTTQEATLGLLDLLRADSVTVMVSTHDLTLAATRFDQIMLLNRRLIAFGPVSEALSTQALSQAFGGQVFFLNGAVVVDQCCPPDESQEAEKHHD